MSSLEVDTAAMNPSIQVHTNDPRVLLHLASLGQTEKSRHSSLSAKRCYKQEFKLRSTVHVHKMKHNCVMN